MNTLENAQLAVDHDPRRADSHPGWEASRRMWKILMLSPTLEIFDALIRDEPVPLSRLDAQWAHRFGLRTEEAA
jgi:hypothetical protein